MEVKTISVGPITNFYAIEENGKTMLVDTGCYLNFPGWTLKAAMSGVDFSTVSLIVLTHGHMDHAGGIHHAVRISFGHVHRPFFLRLVQYSTIILCL